ncbi:unnamed protein product [Brachionus calyciflorus]|uniref:Autophagy-related protein 27 n=1 Tax=Brachionus calyciflorus TaxID=104777 RepID=A0A814NGX3_9BILA|nr:unnamed protein product [Brachionus calyciflorus]
MYFRIKLLFFFAFFFNFASSKSLNNTKNLKFTQLSSCKVQLDDGGLIDLTSLDNPSKPRTDTDNDYDYKFNPCSPITCISGARPTSAACQISTDGKVQYNLGDQSTAVLTYSSNLLMKFSSGEKTTIIQCLCDNSEKFSFSEERPINTYKFTFSSPCCCPNGCSGKKPEKGGLSFGSIILIIFFSCVAAYLIGGFVFLKFVKKASGTDTIPNYAFWASVPSDVKAGFSYSISRVRGSQYNQF